MKFHKLYILLSLPLLFEACSNDVVEQYGSEDENPQEIRLGVSAMVGLSAETKTRATSFDANVGIDEGQEFGVYIFDQYAWQGEVATPYIDYTYWYNNIHATYHADGGLTTDDGMTLYYPYGLNREQDERIKVGICAYSPYRETMLLNSPTKLTERVSFTVDKDQTTETGVKNSDLIVGFPTENPVRKADKEQVVLSMSHAMAQVYLELQLKDEEDTKCDSITITADQFALKGSLNVRTGIMYGDDLLGTVKMAKYDYSELATTNGYKTITATVLFPPQKIEKANPAHFTVTLHGCTNYYDVHGNKQTVRTFKLIPTPHIFNGGICVQYTDIKLGEDNWIVGAKQE